MEVEVEVEVEVKVGMEGSSGGEVSPGVYLMSSTKRVCVWGRGSFLSMTALEEEDNMFSVSMYVSMSGGSMLRTRTSE